MKKTAVPYPADDIGARLSTMSIVTLGSSTIGKPCAACGSPIEYTQRIFEGYDSAGRRLPPVHYWPEDDTICG